MSKKKELTQEEKVTKRKEKRNSFFKSALFSFTTSASTVFELGLNERTIEENRREYYGAKALFDNLTDEELASYCEAYGIMSDTTDNRQDTNTKTL